MKSVLLFIFFSLTCSTYCQAAPISLGRKVVTEDEAAAANNLRNNTTAPNSFIGDSFAEMAKNTAEYVNKCKNGVVEAISVSFKFETKSFETIGRTSLSITPIDPKTGLVTDNNKEIVYIIPSTNPTLAGLYQWVASENKGGKSCGGIIQISGKSCQINIQSRTNCENIYVSAP